MVFKVFQIRSAIDRSTNCLASLLCDHASALLTRASKQTCLDSIALKPRICLIKRFYGRFTLYMVKPSIIFKVFQIRSAIDQRKHHQHGERRGWGVSWNEQFLTILKEHFQRNSIEREPRITLFVSFLQISPVWCNRANSLQHISQTL